MEEEMTIKEAVAHVISDKIVHTCTTEDMHPYECNGKGKCIHCDRRTTEKHNPDNCALCYEE